MVPEDCQGQGGAANAAAFGQGDVKALARLQIVLPLSALRV